MKKNDTAGSSLVRLGNTQVLCGISLQIGTPISSARRGGGNTSTTTTTTTTTTSSSVGNSGGGDVVVVMLSTQQQQQQQQAAAAAAATEEQLQSIIANMLDLSALIIIDGQAAWRIQLTIQVLQDDGNAWDATLLAAVAALTDVNLPATKIMTTTTTTRNGPTTSATTSTVKAGTNRLGLVDDGDVGNNGGGKKTPLVFHYLPVPLTVGVYRSLSEQHSGLHLVADPTPDEAPLLQGYLTMVVTDEDEIVYARHASQVGLTRQHLAVAAHMAYGRGREIRALLQE